MNNLDAINEKLQSQPGDKSPGPLPRRDAPQEVKENRWAPPASSTPLLLSSPDASLMESQNSPTASANLAERMRQTEAELAFLSARLNQIRQEWEQDVIGELRSQFDLLREAVQRYSFACAEVDMRLALMRARADGTGEAAENLRRSLAEQAAASDELRSLARRLR